MNLPVEKHSPGLRQLAAIEASRGSFDAAVDALKRGCGQQVGKRQLEDLAASAVVDFEAFYTARQPPTGDPADVLVLSCDGKGIVMRPDALCPATAKAAKESSTKLASRLSKGEERNRKRMAEVGAVYDITPVARNPAQIMARDDPTDDQPPTPSASGKWPTASVVDDPAEAVTEIFDEADRRDPDHHAPGSPWWTATTTRSTPSTPRRGHQAWHRPADSHRPRPCSRIPWAHDSAR